MSNATGELKLRHRIGVEDDIFSGNYNAYLGISFSKTRYFSTDVVRQYAEWSLNRFGYLLVIIADHLEIYNQIVFKSRSGEQAAVATRSAAEQYRKAYYRAIPEKYRGRCKIELASDLLLVCGCDQLAKQVHGLYQVHTGFRKAVNDTVFYALEGKLKERFGQEVPAEVMCTLARYFLEEIAIILFLTEVAEPAYQVSIFPYAPPEIIVDFYRGKFTLDGLPLPGQLPRAYQALQVNL